MYAICHISYEIWHIAYEIFFRENIFPSPPGYPCQDFSV
jgi:hypothetical protein